MTPNAMSIGVPLIIAVLGGVLYFVTTHPRLNEIGRVAFFCGLFVLTWVLASSTVVFGVRP